MRAIRPKDTKPELLVRKILTSMGYRYRLHRKDIPGRPDIAFIGMKKAIFVHGCFWHVHENCPIAHIPDGKFWQDKLKANQARDANALSILANQGWKVLTIWECELKDEEHTRKSLLAFMGPTQHPPIGYGSNQIIH